MTKKAIVEAFFERDDNGRVIANPEAPKFQEVLKIVDDKFDEDSVTGTLGKPQHKFGNSKFVICKN